MDLINKPIFPSKLSQAILLLRGKPLDLSEYKPFELIYDLAPDSLTAMCGRQIGKSVSLAAAIISNSILRGHFLTLFVSPLSQQTSRFSSQYLAPFMNSRIVKNHYVDSSDKKNVFLRTFNNGSSVTLAYAETEQDADRVRGVTADAFYYDEVQDASWEALPILEETLAASDYGFRRFTGTAKGEANTLTRLFKNSNGMEWVTKCEHCGRWAIPNEFDICLKMLKGNPLGPACPHCSGLLDMKQGKWMAARPSVTRHIGVHIPQICIPARASAKKWPGIVEKALRYDHIKLSNEVFGLPVGAGGRPLSLRQVMSVCNDNRKEFETGFPMDSRNILVTVLGVDWSVTGSTHSHTVVTILGYDFLGKAYVLYTSKLDGMDLIDQVHHVAYLFQKFKCAHMSGDRGVGVFQGQVLQRGVGIDKVSMINYVAAKTNLRYDKQGNYYAADRTLAIDTMVLKIKLGITKIESPSWSLMETFWNDALHVYEEESHSGRRLYKRDDDAPDDFLHSLVFANIAYMIVKGEFVYQDREVISDTTFTFEDPL